MSQPITWDDAGLRLYETGVDHVVLYPVNGVGVPWNGVTSITNDSSGGEPTDIYADNIKYLSIMSAESVNLTLEAYYYPEEFKACDGSLSLAPGMSIGHQKRKRFGLAYRGIVGNDINFNDHGYKLFLVFNGQASPAQKNYQTKSDTPEAVTFSWAIDTTPVSVNGFKPTAMLVIDTARVNAQCLGTIERILYGTEETDARLPFPDEIVVLLISVYDAIIQGILDFYADDGHAIAEVDSEYEPIVEGMQFQFDENGHLLYSYYSPSDIDVSISEGHLVMEIAS